MQVCSTWRAISSSDPLWQRLTHQVWGRTRSLHDSWREEYIYCHRTAQNFRLRRYQYTTVDFDLSSADGIDGLSCRCLALSDHYLASGFADGTVRLFNLATRLHVSTFRPEVRDRLGRFSLAVLGILFTDGSVVFACVDGDIYVSEIEVGETSPRRAHCGDVMHDGALVDFAGCSRWWVGLYAGVPGRSFRVWDGQREQLLFVGGSITDPSSVMGWHLLTELTQFIGRVRVTNQELAVACTSLRFIAFNLRNPGNLLGDEEFERELIGGAFDVSDETFLLMDGNGVGSVRKLGTLEELCRFTVADAARGSVLGCINVGNALICARGMVRVWETEHGGYLYSLREMVGEANAMVADDRHVVACSPDSIIHLWDFGAR